MGRSQPNSLSQRFRAPSGSLRNSLSHGLQRRAAACGAPADEASAKLRASACGGCGPRGLKSRKSSPQNHQPGRRRARAALKSSKSAHTAPPDRKNKPQPAERHSYSSSSKCHNLIRPRAAAARRRKNASSNQHDNPSPMIKRYDPQPNLRCLRPFRE